MMVFYKADWIMLAIGLVVIVGVAVLTTMFVLQPREESVDILAKDRVDVVERFPLYIDVVQGNDRCMEITLPKDSTQFLTITYSLKD